MSLLSRERNQESLQRSLSTPISATTPDSTTAAATDDDGNEPLCGKIDAWIEPPLKAPTPSFQDDGLQRTDQYVFQYMAPLGHMPPIRLLREIKAQELAYFICQNKRKQNRAQAVPSTKELSSPVNALRQQRSAASTHFRARDSTVSNGRRRSSRSTRNRRTRRER